MKRKALSNVHSDNLYEQIYDYIIERIGRGVWGAHDKLPSIRTLATEFNVHRLTVFKAYQLLKQNKKVYVKDKSGYYVMPENMLLIDSQQNPIISAHVQESSLSEIHQVRADYQFSIALLDPNLLPNHYFSEYIKKVFNLYPKVLGTYSSIQGDPELREALSRYFTDQSHFYLTPDELLITSGSQQAIDLIARGLIKPRDTVFFEKGRSGSTGEKVNNLSSGKASSVRMVKRRFPSKISRNCSIVMTIIGRLLHSLSLSL